MDKIINGTITLLVLSLIAERIVNFIKLHSYHLKNTKEKLEDEKKREKSLQKVAFITGIAVAVSCKASIFHIFKTEFNLGWYLDDFKDFYNVLFYLLGASFSGLFLSQGSKFFHDLLDTLLQIKDLKRKLNKKEIYEISKIEEFDEFISNYETDIAKKVLEENRDDLFDIDGVHTVGIGYQDDKEYIEVICDEDAIQKLPKHLPYLLPNKKIHSIPVKIKPQDLFSTQHSIYPSGEIANFDSNNSGSFGFTANKISNKKNYLLTCYHVAKHSDHFWDLFQKIGKETIVHPRENGSEIGKILEATRNAELDVAVIEPFEGIELEKEIPEIGKPNKSRKLTNYDLKYKRKVKIRGKTSGFKEGYVSGINFSAKIKYPDGTKWTLKNLIKINSYSSSPFSKPGDSGSLILDEYNYAIGMVVAGKEDISLAIPINKILEYYNLTI